MIKVEIHWGQFRDEADWEQRVPKILEEYGVPVERKLSGEFKVTKGKISRRDYNDEYKTVYTWEGD